jgi:fatty acid desaturase
VYRVSNYWNVWRLAGFFPRDTQRVTMALNAALLFLGYGVLLWWSGPWQCLLLFGIATLISMALQDLLILSQHTHIPQGVSGGNLVVPLAPQEQDRYTRSLKFPRWFAQWVLVNFNAHELHHRFPGVPGYRLAELDHRVANEVGWWQWLSAAKKLRGSVFVFENRDRTGFQL